MNGNFDELGAGFMRVEAIMSLDDFERLAYHLDTIELDAEVRWALAVLGETFGWTERSVKIGSLLKAVVQDIENPPARGGKR